MGSVVIGNMRVRWSAKIGEPKICCYVPLDDRPRLRICWGSWNVNFIEFENDKLSEHFFDGRDFQVHRDEPHLLVMDCLDMVVVSVKKIKEESR